MLFYTADKWNRTDAVAAFTFNLCSELIDYTDTSAMYPGCNMSNPEAFVNPVALIA